MKFALATCLVLSLTFCNTRMLSAADFDLPGFLAQQLEAGNKRIVIPAGHYRVTPQKRTHLTLQNINDTEIIADNVLMICTETTRAISVSNCNNLTIRGLSIDYDPLPFTQGRIVKLSEDKKIHEIELFDGYPPAEAATTFKYEIFDEKTRILATNDHYPERIEVIDSKHLRIFNPQGSAKDPEQVGNLVVIGATYAPNGSIPHAIVCSDNTNLRLEDITLAASNCFGFFETDCDGSVYKRCRIDRSTLTSDIVKRSDPRLRSLNADAFHSKHAIKGPQLIECVAKFMGDDAVNICGDYHMIMAVDDAQLRVLAKRKMDIAVDDPVELFTYDGRRLPNAKVLKVEKDGDITEPERDFILKQRMDRTIQTKLLTSAYQITLDRNIDVAMGSLIASAKRMGNGFAIRNCDFGFNRSRGILIKASNGIVAGNKLTANKGSAILISPEYWWLESGSASNVEIRDNIISDCSSRAILIKASGGSGKVAPSGAHQNMTITGNTLTNCPAPCIEVTSTDKLFLKDNKFLNTITSSSENNPVKLTNCTNVTQ